jgi:hypothetical protein
MTPICAGLFLINETFDKHSLSRIKGASGIVRAHDDVTGFQSGNVSNYLSGDWQNLWSNEQKQLVDTAIRAALEDRQA